jgi:predicted PurR-regulated permease PerM
MLERLSPARRNLALLALGAVALWFCWIVRGVLNPLLIGYLLAFILHPLVVRVEKRGMSRRSAVNLIFASGFLLAVLMTIGLVSQLRALAIEVYGNIKSLAAAPEGQELPLHDRLQDKLDEFTLTLNGWGLDVKPIAVPELDTVRELAVKFFNAHGDTAGRTGLLWAGRGLSFVARFVGGVLSAAGLFLLVPLYTYYFLFVLGPMHESIRRYFPRRERARLTRVAERIGEVVASFFRGRLSVAFFKGLFLAVGLTIADMPYGFLFGMLSGFLSIVPFVGAFAGFVLALFVGILDHGVIGSIVRAGLVFGAGELVEGYVLVPRILGEKLGLHPLVVFFALLAGGAALGMLGLLLALPITAALVILIQEFVLPALRQFADESPLAGPSP